MALLLAATHPERVSSLVLYGCYAKAAWASDYTWARTQEARRAYTEELVTNWDWEADACSRCPRPTPRCSDGGRSGCEPRQRRPPSVH